MPSLRRGVRANEDVRLTRQLSLDPWELRRRNIVSQFPSVSGLGVAIETGAFGANMVRARAAGARVLSGTRVTLGHRVALGRQMWIETDLTVGDDVLFSGRVGVLSNVHDIDSPLTVYTAPSKPFAPVVLEGDNLVGYGALLIGPCHLERGAVLGAGAVATGRLLADTVYVGIPARPLRTRRRDSGGVTP
mgnify:CR=1 FL=1